MKKYGNYITLLDTTYKTTRYAVPLFFLAINKTNVKYMVVDFFAVQDETTDVISEALNIFKSWNKDWNPFCFMVDNCEEEINAIEENFPGIY